jgi:hypothetical protein
VSTKFNKWSWKVHPDYLVRIEMTLCMQFSLFVSSILSIWAAAQCTMRWSSCTEFWWLLLDTEWEMMQVLLY